MARSRFVCNSSRICVAAAVVEVVAFVTLKVQTERLLVHNFFLYYCRKTISARVGNVSAWGLSFSSSSFPPELAVKPAGCVESKPSPCGHVKHDFVHSYDCCSTSCPALGRKNTLNSTSYSYL